MRRIAAALGVWLCAAAPVLAQDKAALPLVGVLRLNTAQNVEPFPTIFRNALAALGQVDGRNIRIDLRLAEGHAERFPDLAQALVNENASVIVASGDAAVRAAQQATHTIPIIGIVDDIVGAGLINSLAKPGGNTMGVSMLAADLDAKRIEVLKQIAPSGLRFAILNDATNASAQSELFAEAGRLLGVKLRIVDVRSPADFAPAFASIQADATEALVIHSSPLLFGFRGELCGLSITYKLPAIGQSREMAEAGCLMSYGIKISDAYLIAAKLTDKMLKGAGPAKRPQSSRPISSW